MSIQKSALLVIFLCLLGMVIIFSCGDDDDDPSTNSGQADDDDKVDDDDDDDSDDDDDDSLAEGPGGFDPTYRTSAEFFTNMDGLKQGNFNAQVQIWYSSNILPIINDDAFSVPTGTTSIQEVDANADDVVDSITVMVKMDEGYDPGNLNWYYEVRNKDGDLLNIPAPGKIQACIECHNDFAITDNLGGTKLQ